MFVVDNATVRRIDAAAIRSGIEGRLLMERAGAGATAQICRFAVPDDGWIPILCGKGNNGGDGLVVARQLHLAGYEVSALLFNSALSGDALANLEHARRVGVEIIDLGDRPVEVLERLHVEREGRWMVDALLGTGFKPPLRGSLKDLCSCARAIGRRVLALDCPSGLDGDSGAVDEACLEAELTVTFGLAKWGLMLSPGRSYCGRIERVDLDIPAGIVDQEVIGCDGAALWIDCERATELWPRRPVDAHKYRVGTVAVVGASTAMTGAVALVCNAANRAGAGLVEAVVPSSAQQVVDAQCTETLVHGVAATDRGGLASSVLTSTLAMCAARDAVVVGCGAGDDPETAMLLVDLLRELERPTVVDADGLNAFARCERSPKMPARSMITPHSGELARLFHVTAAEIDADRRHWVVQAARELDTVVLHKGAPTFVAAPDGRLALIGSGSQALATAGSGDVLAGICGALLAAGLEPFEAGCSGAWVHGRCGDRAAETQGIAGVVARDLVDELGPVGLELERNR